MKDAELLTLVRGGVPAIVVEFRSVSGDRLKWVNKKGQAQQAPVAKHVCEAGGKPMIVTEWLPEGSDETKLTSPYKKGQLVCCELDKFTEERGIIQATGALSPYLPS